MGNCGGVSTFPGTNVSVIKIQYDYTYTNTLNKICEIYILSTRWANRMCCLRSWQETNELLLCKIIFLDNIESNKTIWFSIKMLIYYTDSVKILLSIFVSTFVGQKMTKFSLYKGIRLNSLTSKQNGGWLYMVVNCSTQF